MRFSRKALSLTRLLRINRQAALQLLTGALITRIRTQSLRSILVLVSIREIFRSIVLRSAQKIITASPLLEFAYRKVRMRPDSSPRWYLKGGMSRDEFFLGLNSKGVKYVVIRWADDLPTAGEPEDIDILCSDEDLFTVREYLTKASLGGQAIDLYSVSGSDGSDYGGRPYFPDALANLLLSSAVFRQLEGPKSPGIKGEILSLVYHLVFHKLWRPGQLNPTNEHQRILRRLATLDPGFDDSEETVLEHLQVLRESEMIPPLEECRMIFRDSPSAKISRLFEAPLPSSRGLAPNLLFLVCRESLFKFGGVRFLEEAIAKDGLQVLKRFVLTDHQQRAASVISRGGNWGKGPFLRAGGLPAEIWVVWDSFPQFPSRGSNSPALVNSNLKLKDSWRQYVNERVGALKHSNMVHSTDMVDEGYQLLEGIGETEYLEELKRTSSQLKSDSLTPKADNPLLGSDGGRSRVWLDIDRQVVTKVFARGYESYHSREMEFYRKFSSHPMVLTPLSSDATSFTLPSLRPLLKSREGLLGKGALLSRSETMQLVNFLRYVNDHGYVLVNCTPENLLLSDDDNLVVIDFEFAQSQNPPRKWHLSSDFIGLSQSVSLERPLGWHLGLDHWDIVWREVTGLTLRELQETVVNS